MSNALSNLATKLKIQIIQKYLVKGHTQMECDSTHALIEKNIHNKCIYLPSQLIELASEARKNPLPLKVIHLHHNIFLKYDDKNLHRYKSIRPGKF